MLALPATATLAHGATGTWLDEFVELGLPLLVFVILYLWSNRKGKAAPPPPPAAGASERDGTKAE